MSGPSTRAMLARIAVEHPVASAVCLFQQCAASAGRQDARRPSGQRSWFFCVTAAPPRFGTRSTVFVQECTLRDVLSTLPAFLHLFFSPIPILPELG